QTVAEAILHVSQKNLGCIPIVKKNGELTGVLTTKDIMDYTAGVIVNSDIFAGE
ncbi:MAG: CBS domain-containing protein, partial [Candidatus Omnitrophota bacterium]